MGDGTFSNDYLIREAFETGFETGFEYGGCVTGTCKEAWEDWLLKQEKEKKSPR